MFIIGEIFSLLAAMCLGYSTFCKSKNKMVFWQIIDSLLNAISNIFLLSYAGSITNIFTAIRNCIEIKGKFNIFFMFLFCILVLSFGFVFNNRGIIGYLPIVASIEYTFFMYKTNNAKNLKLALILNLLLWGIYDLLIKAYPMFVMDIIIIICSIYNVKKTRGN